VRASSWPRGPRPRLRPCWEGGSGSRAARCTRSTEWLIVARVSSCPRGPLPEMGVVLRQSDDGPWNGGNHAPRRSFRSGAHGCGVESWPDACEALPRRRDTAGPHQGIYVSGFLNANLRTSPTLLIGTLLQRVFVVISRFHIPVARTDDRVTNGCSSAVVGNHYV